MHQIKNQSRTRNIDNTRTTASSSCRRVIPLVSPKSRGANRLGKDMK